MKRTIITFKTTELRNEYARLYLRITLSRIVAIGSWASCLGLIGLAFLGNHYPLGNVSQHVLPFATPVPVISVFLLVPCIGCAFLTNHYDSKVFDFMLRDDVHLSQEEVSFCR